MSVIEELDEGALNTVLVTETRRVLVDFWSPWCAPCRVIRPHLHRLAEERQASWRFAAVNAQAQPETAERFGVKALPTFILFSDGEETHRFTGSTMISAIVEKLDEVEVGNATPLRRR